MYIPLACVQHIKALFLPIDVQQTQCSERYTSTRAVVTAVEMVARWLQVAYPSMLLEACGYGVPWVSCTVLVHSNVGVDA